MALPVSLLACGVSAQTAIDNVVVTATKRQSSEQDTPMSLTILGSHALTDANADDFADFAKMVPGLTYTDSGPGEKRYALRGLQSPGEPEVALYYDEVPIAGLPGGSLDTGASQPDLKLWDVDHIEVLRGPQGTLYGNGSEAGTIRILSKRPDLTQLEGASEIEGAVTEGGDPSFRANQMLNLPIIEGKAALRLAGYYRYEGGWIDEVPTSGIALPQLDRRNINTEDTAGGRASLSLQLTDDWNLTAIGWYQHLRTASSFETYPGFGLPGNPWVAKAFVQTPWRDESQMANVISTYDMSWASLVVTGAYQFRTADQTTDTTRYLLSQFGCTIYNWTTTCFGRPLVPAASYTHETVGSWSGEARLASKEGGPLQWVVGSAIQTADMNRRGQVAQVDGGGDIVFDPTTGDAQNRLFARTNYDAFNQYSFFGDGTYELFDGLKASAGLRWYHSDRSDQQIVVQQFFPTQPTGAEPFQEFRQGALFKRFELSYQAEPDSLFYAGASQGFRAGGPNYPGGFTTTAPAYGADSVWDYEAGWKLSFFDRRLICNGAVFRIDWSHLQELVPTALFSYIANAGSARSDGTESTIVAELGRGFSVTAGATYNNARLIGTQPVQQVPAAYQLAAGDPLANVPKWTVNASLGYERQLDDEYALTARFDLTNQSGRGSVVAEQSPDYYRTEGYVLMDLHLTLARTDGWSVRLDVDNLQNTYAELSAKPLDSNLVDSVTAARPRTISLGVAKSF